MGSSTARRRRRTVRIAAGLGATLVLAGCGFEAQTLQPYTPGQGVNVTSGPVDVRNLVVIGDGEGSGLVSASIVSSEADRLTGVTGNALKPDGSDAGELTASSASVELPANELVVLTSAEQPVTVQSEQMVVGGAVELELQFSSGAVASAIAPVVSADHSIYATITPSPAPGSETPVPLPEATPGQPSTPAPEPVENPTPGATP